MKPRLCYTIWMTQRNGSTLLCKSLEQTNIAGKPNEWLLNYYDNPDLLNIYKCSNISELKNNIWEKGLTTNGVFGIKTGLIEPGFSIMLNNIKEKLNLSRNISRIEI